MNSKKEQIWLALVTAIFLSAGLLDGGAQPGSAPILILPNGAQLVFAGTTYGTTNTPPSPEKYIGQNNIHFNEGETFETPQLFVWFQWKETNAPPGRTMSTFIARLADQQGVERGAVTYPAFSDSVLLSYAEFPAIPRRSQMLKLNFYPLDNSSHGAISISFTNPLFGTFPDWIPEPIPAAKKIVDLDVRLAKLMTGVGDGWKVLENGKMGIGVRPAPKEFGLATWFDVSIESGRGTNEEWVVQSADLSDATGNVLTEPVNVSSSDHNVSPMTFSGEYRLSLPGTLWPDEAAWKLTLDLKRKSGFAPEELVTFKNVPIPRNGLTNFLPITNNIGGVRLVFKEFFENGDQTDVPHDKSPETMVAVELPDHPQDIAIDLVKMTTDTGETIEKYGSVWRPFYRGAYLKYIPTNAQTVDITWVVQKMRSVEFLVKPPTTD